MNAKRIRAGLIRVVSALDPPAREAHGRWLMERFPTVSVVSREIKGFPAGLPDRATADSAVPAVVDAARRLASDVDVLLVSCTEDPGVAEIRSAVSIPVLGAGSVLAAVGRALCVPLGVLTLSSEPPRPLRDGLAGADVRWCCIPGVRRTTDLPAAGEGVRTAVAELARQGALAILLGCTGFSTLRISPALHAEFGIPVVDPVLSMGALIPMFYRCTQAIKEVVR